MSTIFPKAVLLTTSILLFKAIHCFVNDFNQVEQCSYEPATFLHFDPIMAPDLQPSTTGENHPVSTTHDYSTVTYASTTKIKETLIQLQPRNGYVTEIHPNALPGSEPTFIPPIEMASLVTKRASETIYYPANLTTATTTVNASDFLTVVDVETSSKHVSATTVVVTPDSETVTTVETSPKLGAAITSAKVNKCPPSQSLISEKDIESLVNFQIKNLGITEALNESFFVEILSFKNNVEQDLTRFLSWFEERPTHMTHIIEYLGKIRDNLQRVLTLKNTEFQEYYALESEYNIKLKRIEKLVKKIEKYKNICKYNCDDDVKNLTRRVYQEHYFVEKRDSNTSLPSTDIPPTEIPGDDEKYYCSKIDDVVKKIANLLLNHLNNSEEEFKDRIANDTKMYNAQVEEFKNVSKSKALAQFGLTMYDLINLQDQYYHFDQDLQVDIQALIRSIKSQFSNVETSLTNLEYQAEKVRKYCSTSNVPIVMLRRYARAIDDNGNTIFEDSSNNGDLVENVTLHVYTDYKNQALADYQNIFNELDAFISASKDEKIMNLKIIQEEIANMTTQEAAELKKLKESLPENSIEKIVNLESKISALNQRIVMLSNDLKEKYYI